VRVLVVEDNDVIVEWLSLVFRMENVDATFISNNFEDLLDDIPDGYDVIICDLMLPGADGGDILRRCRDQHPGMRRIIYSAATEKAVRFETGLAHDILLKGPDNAPELLRAIHHV
jgi:CheY-like chemotaxis protein